MSNIGDLLSIGFIVTLILLCSTFSIALIDTKLRKTFGIITGILTVVAVGFMALFILGFVLYPEPLPP